MPIKKYSKVKFTLRKELIIMAAVIVIMLVASILLGLPTKAEKFQSEWTTAGASYANGELYSSTTFEGLEKKLAKDSGYIYVYFATSSDTDSVKYFDEVYKLASGLEVEKVYIIDAKFALEHNREENEDFDKKLTKIEEKFKNASGDTIDLSHTPNLWVFKDGAFLEEIDHDLIETEGDWNAAALKIFSYAKQN